MNTVYREQSLDDVIAIVDSLALATRVSRHSGFRFVYFGDNKLYEQQVRHLIEERLTNEFSLKKPLSSSDVDMLVNRFMETAHPAFLSTESKKKIQEHVPLAWSEIAG